MATKGIDCAVPLTSAKAAAMAAAGMRFVARYLVPERYAWKRLTRMEATAITAAGMKVVSVFETTTNRPAGGASAGLVDGEEAYREAKAIGQPTGSTIYFAVDYDAQAKDYAAIEAYLRAAASKVTGYDVGVYASCAVVEEMAKRGACKRFWQTYAWSRGKKSAYANIYQYQNGQTLAGHTIDYNESYGGEGWWDTTPVVVIPQPVAKTADAATQEALKVLVANGVIQTPDYWTQNAYEGGVVRGDYAALLLQNIAKKLGSTVPTPTPTPDPTPQQPSEILDWTTVQTMTADVSVAIEVGSGAKPGSGVLLAGGYVLTAKHVGAGVRSIKVRMKSSGSFTATLVADHPNANVDLMLYRIDAKNLPSLTLSNSAITSGQRLLAVVHADGFGTVKSGVVDRASITTATPAAPWKFDCSIAANPGDSGGPIVNQYGQLAGIAVQKTSVTVKNGSVSERVAGCEAINVAHPVVSGWLKNYV